jgi:hypothetical protein
MRTLPFDELRSTDEVLRQLHTEYRVSPDDSSQLRHVDVAQTLDSLANQSRANGGEHRLDVRAVGESFEGRAIRLATIGGGSRKVLMWSQMHGDESTHTAVLLDLLNTLVKRHDPRVAGCPLLERCTLYALPMLNPDGAERQTRTNAQDIDVNRDAVDLATPEGRVLRTVVNELRPSFGFNLHNQRADKKVGTTNKIAIISVLAPPLDEAESVTPGIVRAKQLSLEMFAVGERHLPGHSTRYEAGYMPTAFGEWVQSRGATTALLEAGGWPEGSPSKLIELHYVTLVSALLAIANDQLEHIDASLYETLPLNG